jgi:hypothetical protein
MARSSLKVLVSRPSIVPARAPVELRRRFPDFCWTNDGEVLTFPDFPCADVDVCGCGSSFAGVTSAKATTWGVVELRSATSIATEVRGGKHLAGWSMVEGFYAHILAGIREISERIHELPTGATLGVWALGDDRFSLFDRSLPRALPAFTELAAGNQDREQDDSHRRLEHPDFE